MIGTPGDQNSGRLRLTIYFIALFCLLAFSAAQAQVGDPYRFSTIPVGADTIVLDSMSVVPGSILLRADGKELPASAYTLDAATATLIWRQRPPVDSVRISYRVYPYSFSKPYYHKDVSLLEPSDQGNANPLIYTQPKNPLSLFSRDGLNKQGSISRGLSFGNNQDLSVNSDLNLQLSGRVTDKINILAAITDDNIPIQPEGNTQQLQEFDQVYIQLYDKDHRLTAGDFQLRSEGSYFMNYFKKARGGSIESQVSVGPDTTRDMRIRASAAVSRGKFSRNIIQGVEGNQGPYRLRGSEGELFVIILSGTERVFIDGKLLKRGQEFDYVIDYNTAEITFTARQMITKDKRIIVEFQYTDQNYARSLVEFSDYYEKDNLKLWLNVYSEQDSRNQPLQQELSEQDKLILSNIGDSLNQALAPNIDSIGFQEGAILYAVVDTTVDDVFYDSVFVFSTSPDSAFYRLGFSNVGAGNGNYVLDQTLANGKVYRWVAPVGGVPQGDHEPLVLLVTPKQRQMATLAGEYKLGEQTLITFEGAVTNNDINTFSELDSGNDDGFALKFGVTNKKPLSKAKVPWVLTSEVAYEQVDRDFQFIERFRSVEFERDWNILNKPVEASQFISGASVGISKARIANANYRFESFNSPGSYNATRSMFRSDARHKGWEAMANASLVQSDGFNESTYFLRHEGKLAHHFGWMTVGVEQFQDYLEIREQDTDSLLPNAINFWEWKAFVNNGDSAKNKYELSYVQRQDELPLNNQFALATVGESWNLSFDIISNPKSTLRGKTTYRELRIRREEITNDRPDNTLLSRLEYTLKLFKGGITSASFYEIGSGLEVRKEFQYIEVPAGQGVYTWTDYNDNGQQELDEFEIAQFSDQANFIKVFTPTNEFVKAFTNEFNQAITFRPRAVWGSEKGFRKFVSRFSNQVAFRVRRKTNEEDALQAYNPFLSEVADTSLVSLASSIRNTFFFNRTDPRFGAEVAYQNRKNKDLLTNGFESKSNRVYSGKIRWNLTRAFLFNLEYEEGSKAVLSDFFSSRTYDVGFFAAEPKLTYQPGTTFRLALLFNYGEQLNASEYGGESAITRTFGTEAKYNSVGKGSLQGSINWINISWSSAQANSPVAYEMLNALQPGQNLTWDFNYQRTLANNLQLSILYSGRASAEINTVHTGGVQLRAFF